MQPGEYSAGAQLIANSGLVLEVGNENQGYSPILTSLNEPETFTYFVRNNNGAYEMVEYGDVKYSEVYHIILAKTGFYDDPKYLVERNDGLAISLSSESSQNAFKFIDPDNHGNTGAVKNGGLVFIKSLSSERFVTARPAQGEKSPAIIQIYQSAVTKAENPWEIFTLKFPNYKTRPAPTPTVNPPEPEPETQPVGNATSKFSFRLPIGTNDHWSGQPSSNPLLIPYHGDPRRIGQGSSHTVSCKFNSITFDGEDLIDKGEGKIEEARSARSSDVTLDGFSEGELAVSFWFQVNRLPSMTNTDKLKEYNAKIKELYGVPDFTTYFGQEQQLRIPISMRDNRYLTIDGRQFDAQAGIITLAVVLYEAPEQVLNVTGVSMGPKWGAMLAVAPSLNQEIPQSMRYAFLPGEFPIKLGVG